MNDRKLNTAYITSPYYVVMLYHNTIWYSSLNFLIFLLVAKGPIYLGLPLPHDCSECAEEWKLHSTRKWLIMVGKWTKHFNWPASSKCKSWLAWAQTHKKMPVADRLSPPPAHMYPWKWLFCIIHIFWRNDFIMGIIVYAYSPLGHDKLRPMHNGWQFCIFHIKFNWSSLISK